MTDLEALQEAAWNLLDAMRACEFAIGRDEQRDARWECTRMEAALREVLTRLDEEEQPSDEWRKEQATEWKIKESKGE